MGDSSSKTTPLGISKPRPTRLLVFWSVQRVRLISVYDISWGDKIHQPEHGVQGRLEMSSDLDCVVKIEPSDKWSPSQEWLIELMLDAAQPKASDRLVDLGSGDGRLVRAAIRRGLLALGVEGDPKMVAFSSHLDRMTDVVAPTLLADARTHNLSSVDIVVWSLSWKSHTSVDLSKRMRPGSVLISCERLHPGFSLVREVPVIRKQRDTGLSLRLSLEGFNNLSDISTLSLAQLLELFQVQSEKMSSGTPKMSIFVQTPWR